MNATNRRKGMATGDALLVLAALALAFALAYPRVERVATRATAEEAAAAVETVRAAVEAFREARGTWPPPSAMGEVPPDLVPHLPQGFTFTGPGYALKWDTWVRVRVPETPPPEAPELPLSAESAPPPPPPELDSLELPNIIPTVLPLGAITVRADDDRILSALLETFGVERSFIREDAWTLVFGQGEPAR